MAEGRERQEEGMTKSPKDKEKPKPPDWLIENITEASKNARKIYFLYLGFLAYCALTVVSTSDRQIILGETASLPILKLDVSLNGFFLLAPLIAIIVFVYFQLYLHRLKSLIVRLRTNYASIEKGRLYPWMVTIAEDPDPGNIGTLQRLIVGFSLWTSLTLVLILFAIWYVKKHEPMWSYVIGSAPIVGALITFWFWLNYEPGKSRKSVWRKTFSLVGFSFVVAIEICILFFLIPWAREGGKYNWIRPLICVDLSYQKLVAEPETDYENIPWLNLRGVHLEGANLTAVVLKRADLRDSHLRGVILRHGLLEETNLMEADLQGAKLYGANLKKCNLQEADLTGANLHSANLAGSNLSHANLSKTNLWYTNLSGAGLGRAILKEADLKETNLKKAGLYEANLEGARLENPQLQDADLQGASFQGASLTDVNLKKADAWYIKFQKASLNRVNLEKADLFQSNFEEASLTDTSLAGASLFNANLQKAKLSGAYLQGANLRGANLQKADLRGAYLQNANHAYADLQKARLGEANLTGADLEGADLRGAEGLTVHQFARVRKLRETKLDPELMEQIKKEYPNLLGEPKDDE